MQKQGIESLVPLSQHPPPAHLPPHNFPFHIKNQNSCDLSLTQFRLSTELFMLYVMKLFHTVLKGTVSRDFSCPVFFIKQLILVPIGKPRNDFEFIRIFVELFVFVIDSPVMNTSGSRLESLRLGNFCKHKSHVPKE